MYTLTTIYYNSTQINTNNGNKTQNYDPNRLKQYLRVNLYCCHSRNCYSSWHIVCTEFSDVHLSHPTRHRTVDLSYARSVVARRWHARSVQWPHANQVFWNAPETPRVDGARSRVIVCTWHWGGIVRRQLVMKTYLKIEGFTRMYRPGCWQHFSKWDR